MSEMLAMVAASLKINLSPKTQSNLSIGDTSSCYPYAGSWNMVKANNLHKTFSKVSSVIMNQKSLYIETKTCHIKIIGKMVFLK